MKTFRLIGMALLAVVMSMNFTSCSDDDEPSKNDDGVITNQKQLVELRMTYEDEVSITEYPSIILPSRYKFGELI